MPLEFIQFTSEKAVEQANQIGSYPRFINQDSRFGDVRKYTFSLIPISQMYWEQALLYQTGPSMLVINGETREDLQSSKSIRCQWQYTVYANFHRKRSTDSRFYCVCMVYC